MSGLSAGGGIAGNAGLTPSEGVTDPGYFNAPAAWVDFTASTALPGWITFARTGNAMLFDSTGKLTYAPNNLLLNSVLAGGGAGVAPTSWGAFGTSFQPVASVYGFGTAYRFTSAASRNFLSQTPTLSASTTYIYSAFVELNTGGTISDMLAVVATPAGTTVTYPQGSNTVPAAGTRIYAIISVGATAGTAQVRIGAGGGGNVTADLTLSASQVEQVTYQTTPSAYNPTTSAAYYGPRFDYDPSTSPATPRGLLIEESRQNILIYSNGASSGWSASGTGSSWAPNNVVSPDGTQSGGLYTQGTSGAHALGQGGSFGTTITVSPSTAYVFSFWAKLGTATHVAYSVYDLTHAANIVASTDYVASVNTNTWTRVTVAFTTPAGCTSINVYPDRDSASAGTVYFSGLQLEPGSFATSYIPTTSAAVTRAADVATGNTANFPMASGSFLVQAKVGANGAPGNANMMEGYYNAGAATGLTIASNGTGTAIRVIVRHGINRGDFNLGEVSIAANLVIRAGGSWGASAPAAAAANGVSLTSGATPGESDWQAQPFNIGSRNAGSTGVWGGWIQSLAIYSSRLPDSILKAKSVVGAAY